MTKFDDGQWEDYGMGHRARIIKDYSRYSVSDEALGYIALALVIGAGILIGLLIAHFQISEAFRN